MSGGAGYNISNSAHLVKDAVNRRMFSRFRGQASRLAVVLPSTTANDIRICCEYGIYDKNTRFVIFEHGIAGISRSQFVCKLEPLFRRAMGDRQWKLHDHLEELFYCSLNDPSSYLGNIRRFADRVDFANYDTCSNYAQITKWLPYHMGAIRRGSPVMLTLDADYNLRHGGDEIRDMAGRRWPRGVEFFCDGDFESSFSNRELLDDIDRHKIPGVINFLKRQGVKVEAAARYRDGLPMMMIVGRKV